MALNVLDTTTVTASGSAYIAVKTGTIRCTATAASTLQINDGPVIQLPAISAGDTNLHVGTVKGSSIRSATNVDGSVITVNVDGRTPAHPFEVGDYIQTVDGGDTANFGTDFESAAATGKKVTAVSNTTITTDIDASGAAGAYTLAAAQENALLIPRITRVVKLTAGSGADVIVEQVQVVGG